MKYDWYQTETHIILNILIKNLVESNIEVDFESSELTVNINTDSSTTQQLHLDLYAQTSDQKYEVLSTKLELKLKKVARCRWPSLEPTEPQTQAPKYPSSSKKKSDWSAAEKEGGEIKEGDDLSNLFKSIFKDGSDETRMAMQKSFTESGGTCLSTDWSKIGKGKVEVTPPDGMQAKEFEK